MRFTRTAARLLVATLTLTGAAVATAVPAASAAGCSDLDVIVARGTGEPGNLGVIVGDPLYSAIQGKITTKTLSSYAVDYPASITPGSVTQGNEDLVEHVQQQAAACANQRFVLVGYSQGANVVGNSIGISSEGAVVGGPIVATIPAELAPRVAALLVFGPPIGKLGKHITGTYQGRTKEFCAQGDNICEPGGSSVPAHLSYRRNAGEAADFVAGTVG
ncbi:cutinase family protein [Amycolatopsis anabasis]|uniref:cutinase family protein n=1 Tax=Amycolatopsis anabasis TaxID=1840409 RepID=UPI00131B34DF|nr:cutinase family protein [Amycolatopsis anabasis]